MSARYCFIINPVSGGGKGLKIAEVLSRIISDHPMLKDAASEVLTTDLTNGLGQVAQCQVAVVVGGDGTVSQLAARLLHVEPAPALGIIPIGTSNDLARALEVPLNADFTDELVLRETVDRLLAAKPARLDLFCVNKKFVFCNYFSVGFDAAIVRDFQKVRCSKLIRWLPQGRFLNNAVYFLLGVKNVRSRIPPPISIVVESPEKKESLKVEHPIRTIIFSNLSSYAGGCRINPTACMDDEMIELLIVRTLRQFIMMILTRFLPWLQLPRGIQTLRVKRAEIRLQSAVVSQLDGEMGPCLSPPCRLEVEHIGSIEILV